MERSMENNTIIFHSSIKFDDYIVRDHRVHGVRILPGVTLIELLYRGLEDIEIEIKKVRLKSILFQEAIAVSEEYDRDIDIIIRQEEEDFDVIIQSKELFHDGRKNDKWIINMKAKLEKLDTVSLDKIDLEEIKENADKQFDMNSLYAVLRTMDVRHYEFMKTIGTIYRKGQAVLAELSLGELSKTFVETCVIHPAFLDSATFIQLLLNQESLEEADKDNVKPFIPFYVGANSIYKRLGDKCYVSVKNNRGNRDLVYSDIYIYDEYGELAASFEEFGCKEVREKESITRLVDTDTEMNKTEVLEKEPESKTQEVRVALHENLSEEDLYQAIRMEIRGMCSRLMKRPVEEISFTDDYYDQGLDSANLLDLVKLIERSAGKELYPTLLFEYSNIDALSKYLVKNYQYTYTVQESANDDIREDNTTAENVSSELEDAKVIQFKPIWSREEKIDKNINIVYGKRVVLMTENKSLMKTLAKSYRKLSADVICVSPRFYYEKKGEHNYILDPTSEDDVNKLMESISIGHAPSVIVYDLSQEHKEVWELFKRVHLIVKAWMTYFANQNLKLVLAHKGSADCAAFLALDAYLKTACQENQRLSTTVLSYKAPISKVVLTDSRYKESIMEESMNSSTGVTTVCYNKNRYVKKFAIKDKENNASKLKKFGVYIISGGYGKIGLLTAEFLIKQTKGTVILVGRHKPSEEVKERITETMQYGGKIEYELCDISDEIQLRNLRTKLIEKYLKVNGVIHCAGVVRDAMIVNKEREDMLEVLKPKTRGVDAICNVFKNDYLDFVMTFSSISAVLGNVGQADYAYGNAYMDHVMTSEIETSKIKTGISINWPLWADGGMEVSENTKAYLRKNLGMELIKNEEAVEVLEQAFCMETGQLVVIKGMEDAIQQIIKPEEEEVQEQLDKADSKVYDIEVAKGSSSSYCILGATANNNCKEMLDYWDALREEREPEFQVDTGKICMGVFNQKREMIQHLLLKTSTSKNMEVVKCGQGAPVLLIGGFGVIAPQFLKQFEAWKNTYQLIVIHTPGTGLSEGGKINDMSDIGRCFTEVLNMLEVKEQLNIIGVSWGGLIAQYFAYLYPERVSTLVLSNSFIELNDVKILLTLREVVRKDFEQIGCLDVYEQFRKSEYRNPSMKKFGGSFHKGMFSTKEIVDKISTPTLIVAGEFDTISKKEEAEKLHANIKNSEIHTIKGAGHVPNLTHSLEFNTVVEQFIQKNI